MFERVKKYFASESGERNVRRAKGIMLLAMVAALWIGGVVGAVTIGVIAFAAILPTAGYRAASLAALCAGAAIYWSAAAGRRMALTDAALALFRGDQTITDALDKARGSK